MSDYNKMFNEKNLTRAYRWVRSSSYPLYKNFFRDSYDAFSLGSKRNINRIKEDLKKNRFLPTHASKLYFPKPSGVLRPYTLLTVNDQIVFQACINIIAEKLSKKKQIKLRRRKRVFQHLYAGSRSKFFYLKWEESYRLFTKEFLDYHSKGFIWLANFDLAAFYDSIDHNVIRHFLAELKIEPELTNFLLNCLKVWTSSTWTSTTNAIYHDHGIPQGPLSSGLLSEVVLQHIDEKGELGIKGRKIKYLRYVDDIKILAKSEMDLRKKLVALDIASKELGLFPQTSKINIRKVKSPIDEIKTVSIPPEPSIGPFGNQIHLIKRILEISKFGKVEKNLVTKFKYLLGHVEPTYKINIRLLKVLNSQPELSPQITLYFSKFKKLPLKTSEGIIDYIKGQEIYHSVHAELLECSLENMQDQHKKDLASYCKLRLFDKNLKKRRPLEPQPTYKIALINWCIKNNQLNYSEFKNLVDEQTDWWVRKGVFRFLSVNNFGYPTYENFLNEALAHSEVEFSRSAANELVVTNTKLFRPYGKANDWAKISLRAAKIIRAVGQPRSLVGSMLEEVLDVPNNNYDWGKYFGLKHNQAEHMGLIIRQKFETDIDRCVVLLDSFCDLAFKEICDRFFPGISYGYGSILHFPPRIIRSQFPQTLLAFKRLHDLRGKSFTAHPRSHHSPAPTRRLKHSDFSRIRWSLKLGILEIESQVSP